MNKILAIKGDRKRGDEVIALLEMFGGINCHNLYGDKNYACYIIENGEIKGCEYLFGDESYAIFTLDEYYKKYPYKVGDIVKTGKDEEGVIKQMRWVNNDIVYWVNSHKTCDWTQTLSVDVLDKYNRLNSNDVDAEVNYMRRTGYTLNELIDLVPLASDSAMIVIRDGFEIIEDTGKFFVKKKKTKYPATYEECWKVRFEVDGDTTLKEFHHVSGYYSGSLGALQKLLCCRDAYWKIYGEEMGLDKSWKPEFGKCVLFDIKFYLYQDDFVLHKGEYNCSDNCILVFPTAEMRDAFYDNFKNLIEQCKEFL